MSIAHEILKRIKLLDHTDLNDLMQELGIPSQQRPSIYLSNVEKQSQIVFWADENNLYETLLNILKRDEIVIEQVKEAFKKIKGHQFHAIEFLLNVPIQNRPSNTLSLAEKQLVLIRWAKVTRNLENLLQEIKEQTNT